MTITDILQQVDIERKIESRFPVRVIFCESLEEYRKLVTRLRGACDCCWNLAEFCSEKYPDKYPKFRRLIQKIEENQGKHILLLSVGEYLRMATKFEVYGDNSAQFYDLWSRMESVYSKTRIFIPIFAAREYFNRAVGIIDERQQDFIWELDSDDEKTYSLTVYSEKFKNALPSENIAHNIKEWLEKWQDCYAFTPAMIMTRQIENWEKTYGKVTIDIVENPYEFLCNFDHNMETIKKDSTPEEFWADLMIKSTRDHSIKEAILESLNLKEFDSVAVASQWEYLTDIEQWYVWLWYQLNNSDGYVAAIIKKLSVSELKDVPRHISNDIIYYLDSHPEWITQRHGLIKSLSVITPSQEFFKALDTKEPEVAINLLMARTIEEKAYIIKTICRWLRDNDDETTSEKVVEALDKVYPELSAYFKTKKSLYKEYASYFEWYKRKKIINRQVDSPLPAQDVDLLETRFSLMAEYDDKDCISYWIDGLGLEWISLLCFLLDQNRGDTFLYTSDMAKCVIPSETMFNEQWNLNSYESIKRNRLDNISHKGMPDDKDYFLAVANQIQVITEMVQEALQQLENHEYVIITGDHGSSRLAALAFHGEGTIVPKGAKSMELGRFCLLKGRPEDTDYIPESSIPCVFGDDNYLVMKNYDHFIQPGNAAGGNDDDNAVAGEVHGGLTPEECIVPVIVIHRKNKPVQLSYKIDNKKLLSMGGKATLRIEFNSPVQSLQIITNNGECECIQNNVKEWMAHFSNLHEGEAELEIIADNKMLTPKKIMQVGSRGLQTNSMGLGGLL